GVGHRQDGEAEGEGDADEADPELDRRGVAAEEERREDCAAAAAEDEPEGAEEFRDQFASHDGVGVGPIPAVRLQSEGSGGGRSTHFPQIFVHIGGFGATLSAMEKFDEKEHFARTRRSLIERLADWEDQRTWDDFYQTYWRLIYSVSVKAGLSREEAFDVVQETVLAVAKQWRKGQIYDPEKGSFKTWLMNITRWRIADQFRMKQRNPAAANQAGGTPGG